MDLSERLDQLAHDIAQLASAHTIHASTARSLTDQLSHLRVQTDHHAKELVRLDEVVGKIHALTKGIRDSQDTFAGDTVKHVAALHMAVSAHSAATLQQNETLGSIARGVAEALERSDSQRVALEQFKKWRALGATILVVASAFAGLAAGYFR